MEIAQEHQRLICGWRTTLYDMEIFMQISWISGMVGFANLEFVWLSSDQVQGWMRVFQPPGFLIFDEIQWYIDGVNLGIIFHICKFLLCKKKPRNAGVTASLSRIFGLIIPKVRHPEAQNPKIWMSCSGRVGAMGGSRWVPMVAACDVVHGCDVKKLLKSGKIIMTNAWEPKTFIFRGCDPYIEGLKPLFFMVLGSKGFY